MKKIFFVLLSSFLLLTPLSAQWCGYPCTERYYNANGSNGDGLYYGYFDINDYPYALPVNYYFNPCPCPSRQCYDNYRYFLWCQENSESQACCPYCNSYHD